MSNNTKPIKVMSKDVRVKYDPLPTKSARIRYLKEQGWATADIARFMQIRYQHVRNVLITPVKTPQV